MSAIKTLLSSRPVAYYPELARAVGGIAPALFLQQVAHWQGGNEEQWVYRTQEQLEEELAMGPRAQQSARKHLVRLGVLEEERRGIPARLYYRVNWETLNQLLQTYEKAKQDPAHRANKGCASSESINESNDENMGSTEEKTSFSSGEAAADADGPPPDKKKAVDVKQYAVTELMNRVKAKREAGAHIDSPTNSERGAYAAFFDQALKDGYEVDTCLAALDYQVAKAAGEIENEPAAWCGYRTALRRVVEGGGHAPYGDTRTGEQMAADMAEAEEAARAEAELIESVLRS